MAMYKLLIDKLDLPLKSVAIFVQLLLCLGMYLYMTKRNQNKQEEI